MNIVLLSLLVVMLGRGVWFLVLVDSKLANTVCKIHVLELLMIGVFFSFLLCFHKKRASENFGVFELATFQFL